MPNNHMNSRYSHICDLNVWKHGQENIESSMAGQPGQNGDFSVR